MNKDFSSENKQEQPHGISTSWYSSCFMMTLDFNHGFIFMDLNFALQNCVDMCTSHLPCRMPGISVEFGTPQI